MSVEALEQATGGLWPYLVLILVGFLPTEIWRWLGVAIARRLDEQSPVLVWVRAVASALVAGVVAKLVLAPSGALAFVPVAGRLAALGVGLAALFLFRRSVLAALAIGEVVLVGLGFAYGR